MKRIIILLAIPLLFSTCEQINFEDYDHEYYFDVIGVGYIINGETNQPYCKGLAFYHANTESHGTGWGSGPISITKKFEVDENGFFRVKFLKRTKWRDVVSYGNSTNIRYNGKLITLSMVEKANGTIYLDTIKIYPDTIMIEERLYYANLDTLKYQILYPYADNGIWKIENGIDWLSISRGVLSALPLPDSVTECRMASVTADYPNGRKDKYIVVQVPRTMENSKNCFK